jgi:antitoxin component YwqK of YwqJK toxin-antitoxin module
MIRIGAVFAVLSLALVGCQSESTTNCPSGAQLTGKQPPAGQLQYCARANGVKHGPWREWYANGKPKSAGAYAEGKMDGNWQTFYESGSLKTDGIYKSGLKDGVWTQYYDKDDGGTKNRVEEHHAGSNDVKWTAFRADGRKWAEGTLRGSRPDGAYTEYHENGKVAVKGIYTSGEKTGDWSYFDDEGRPSSTPTGSFDQE